MPSGAPMQMPSPQPSPQSTPGGEGPLSRIPPPPKDWPKPVEDEHPFLFFLADLLEFRPKGGDSDFLWDTEGWYGGDYNRIWFKSEGEQSATTSDNNIDFQLLYGRFVRRYYDFQVGLRLETRTIHGSNRTRAQMVVGLEGLVPNRYELETALFISQKGDVSGRVTFSRDYLITQRLILQPRIEANAAIQEVERFRTGRGLNNIELGFRLRYEIRREFAPYFGVTFDRSFFGTADFVRQDGGDPSQVRFVVGVRVWR